MKKVVSFLLLCCCLLYAGVAYSDVVRDAVLGRAYTFDDNAKLVLTDCGMTKKIAAIDYWMDSKITIESDSDEYFVFLKGRITNFRNEEFIFGSDVVKVAVVYNNKFTFTGVVGQFSFKHPDLMMNDASTYLAPKYEHVGKMYSRDFIFFCRIPDNVAHDKKSPLRMIIKLDSDEVGYAIRK